MAPGLSLYSAKVTMLVNTEFCVARMDMAPKG